jgi:hypothetical protein
MQSETKFSHKLSIVQFLAQRVKKFVEHISWDAQRSWQTSLPSETTYLSAVSLVTAIRKELLSVLKTQCIAEFSCGLMFMERMRDDYRGIYLTISAFDSLAGNAALEHALRYPDCLHPDADMFRRLEQRLRETE